MRSEQKHAFDKDGFPRNNEEISLLNQIDHLNEALSKIRKERDQLADLLKQAISEPAASYISLAVVEQSIAILNKLKPA